MNNVKTSAAITSSARYILLLLICPSDARSSPASAHSETQKMACRQRRLSALDIPVQTRKTCVMSPALTNDRRLQDLVSVGKATCADFELMGIRTVAQLAKRDPEQLYRELSRLTGQRQDPCVLDTFRAAVQQARDPRLPLEQCRWWYWSRVRKAEAKSIKAH